MARNINILVIGCKTFVNPVHLALRNPRVRPVALNTHNPFALRPQLLNSSSATQTKGITSLSRTNTPVVNRDSTSTTIGRNRTVNNSNGSICRKPQPLSLSTILNPSGAPHPKFDS
ncbi:hypothetical protein CBL_10899 [Carabus blaptoides fortunei]